MSSAEQLRQEWKEANDKVRVAEERLGAAWADFASGRGGPPGKELLDEIATLRRECDKRLTAILENFPPSNKPTARSRSERPSS